MTTDLVLAEIDPDDDAALRSWFDLRRVVDAVDLPGDPPNSWALHVGRLRHPWPGSEHRAFLAHRGGDAVGWVALSLPMTENRTTAQLDLQVLPAYRGQGLGRALLAVATQLAADLGRSRLVAEATGEDAWAFATVVGATCALVDTERRLDLTTLDEAALGRLHAEAVRNSHGYSLLQWAGPTPDQHLGAVAALESRMSTDAPMDDLQWDQEVYDDDRLRARDSVLARRGARPFTTVVRHDATDRVVGETLLVVSSDVPQAANQWATIVEPEHRGHRLGLLLKIANLRQLMSREPAVTTIGTWNADSNVAMLRVNVAMGFTAVRRWGEWELVLPRSAATA